MRSKRQIILTTRRRKNPDHSFSAINSNINILASLVITLDSNYAHVTLNVKHTADGKVPHNGKASDIARDKNLMPLGLDGESVGTGTGRGMVGSHAERERGCAVVELAQLWRGACTADEGQLAQAAVGAFGLAARERRVRGSGGGC